MAGYGLRFWTLVVMLGLATGAGAYGRHSVGTAIVGGMVLSTVLNLFFIPVLYVILKTVLVRFSKKPQPSTVPEDMTAV